MDLSMIKTEEEKDADTVGDSNIVRIEAQPKEKEEKMNVDRTRDSDWCIKLEEVKEEPETVDGNHESKNEKVDELAVNSTSGLESSPRTVFKCEICNQTFDFLPAFVRHGRTHGDTKPLEFGSECYVCGEKFLTRAKLLEHQRIHTGDMPLKCDVCGKSFARRDQLIQHRHTHDTVQKRKPYKCEVCKKTFRERKAWISHSQRHAGEKALKCNLCDKSFSGRDSLIAHERNHAGDRPFKCNVCNKSFTKRGILDFHISKFHTEEKKTYKCAVCEELLTSRKDLICHQRTHAGLEAPFKCDACDECFTSIRGLAIHGRVHSVQFLVKRGLLQTHEPEENSE